MESVSTGQQGNSWVHISTCVRSFDSRCGTSLFLPSVYITAQQSVRLFEYTYSTLLWNWQISSTNCEYWIHRQYSFLRGLASPTSDRGGWYTHWTCLSRINQYSCCATILSHHIYKFYALRKQYVLDTCISGNWHVSIWTFGANPWYQGYPKVGWVA